MRLYILRHGSSPTSQEAGVGTDAERPLSDSGRRDVRRISAYLKEEGGSPHVILTSPLARARQTSEEASRILAPRLGVRAFPPLENKVRAEALHRLVMEEAGGCSEVLAVGHQPQLGEWIAHLTGSFIDLKAGGLAALETEGKRFRLLWSRNPSDLAAPRSQH